jgi:peptidoglycan/xylan/chitin deacetylase (PgdA/CDA1 family)
VAILDIGHGWRGKLGTTALQYDPDALYRPPLILNYHGIRDISPNHDPLRLYVSPVSLERQIRALKRRGYEFLSMADFGCRLNAGEPLRATCALTFDDGTEDHATVVPEVLEKTGVPGTIYVCPGLLGEPYPWTDPAAGVRFMTDEQLDALAHRPLIEIGAHTMKHTKLADADANAAYREMLECKDDLEARLGREITSFCYPSCDYSPPCPDAALRAGFLTAVTCRRQGSWDPMELKRESVHTPDGPLTFALKSRGLYYGSRDLPPFRLVRWATRPFRHRRERDSRPTG